MKRLPTSRGLHAAFIMTLSALLITLTTSGCASTPHTFTLNDEMDRGETLYRRRCNECHGLHAPHRYSDEQWAEIVPGMAREARLSTADALRVLTYLQRANGERSLSR